MDMTDSLWEHAVWINFFERNNAKWSDIEYFCVKFNCVLKFEESMFESLYEEFLDFKTLQNEELPEVAFEEALIGEDTDNLNYRMDVIWYYIKQLRNPIASNVRFKLLFQVASLVLVLPHSNASIERVFSLVNKNKREGSARNRLDIEGSLSSILAVKLNRPESVSKMPRICS